MRTEMVHDLEQAMRDAQCPPGRLRSVLPLHSTPESWVRQVADACLVFNLEQWNRYHSGGLAVVEVSGDAESGPTPHSPSSTEGV